MDEASVLRHVDIVIIGKLHDALRVRDSHLSREFRTAFITGGETTAYAERLIETAKVAIITIGAPEAIGQRGIVDAIVRAKSRGIQSIWMEAELSEASAWSPLQSPAPVAVHEEVRIPSGEFIRGTSDAQEATLLKLGSAVLPFEKPARLIALDAYWIDVYPVTNQQFLAFVESSGYEPEGVQGHPAWRDSWAAGQERHPAVCISRQDAYTYCDWGGRRLPTEAEWERAARGDDGRLFPWGNAIEEGRCNSGAAGHGLTLVVDAYPEGESPYGCLDMVGNVWEWVQDWLDLPPGPSGGYYEAGPATNPRGPSSGTSHVMRGGSYRTHVANCRCAFRIAPDASTRYREVGFRTARDG